MATPIESQQLEAPFVPFEVGQRPDEGAFRVLRLGSFLRRATRGIALLYAVVPGLGIALSDSATSIEARLLKAVAVAAVSGGLLYVLLQRAAKFIERTFAELSQREAESKSSGEPFIELADNLEQVFWFGHPDKIVLQYVNEAYESIFGLSRESLISAPTSWLASVHPEDRERLMAGFARYLTGKWHDTFRIVRPDGGVRWIRARIYMTRDAEGRPYRVAGVSQDVTELRQLEEQLRQSQKMEPVGRLAGGIAHDFNNLLTVILSHTGLLLAQCKLEEPVARGLLEVHRAGERAAELTHQLLAFSRQQVLRPKVLDLKQILSRMESMLRRLLPEDIEFALRVPASCAKVHADPSQLEQVIMNLAVNARDAMPAGGKLTIELADVELDDTFAAAHPDVEPGQYVMLAVTDTGVGMDAGTRERMFEPFFTTKERGKGTGLGLATVFGVVKQSRGHLQVSTEKGHGTALHVYLPATELTEDERSQQREQRFAPIQGWETVLLVEDDDQVREAARAILSHYGYRVLAARDGNEAYDTCGGFAGEIHLLLTDVVMPGIGGFALAEKLGSLRPSMKALFMSGYTDNEGIHQEGLSATVAFLAKPFTPDELLRHVRKALSKSGAAS